MPPPQLSIQQILAWADTLHRRTGKWPRTTDGKVWGAPGEKWRNINMALRQGSRGLPRGSSLARLLAEHRGVRNRKGLPWLTVHQILTWADAHQRRTGKWPTRHSGPINEAPGETWLGVQSALDHGARGLPGGSSLARLLAKYRRVRNRKNLRNLTYTQVVTWAKAYLARLQRWPTYNAGPLVEEPGETWAGVDAALRDGYRGFPGGSSLYRLLKRAQSEMGIGLTVPLPNRRRPPVRGNQARSKRATMPSETKQSAAPAPTHPMRK